MMPSSREADVSTGKAVLELSASDEPTRG